MRVSDTLFSLRHIEWVNSFDIENEDAWPIRRAEMEHRVGYVSQMQIKPCTQRRERPMPFELLKPKTLQNLSAWPKSQHVKASGPGLIFYTIPRIRKLQIGLHKFNAVFLN